jgi:hypothetical protein
MAISSRIGVLSVAGTITLIVVTLLAVRFFRVEYPRGELGQAGAWTLLQSLDLQHRTDSDRLSPLLVQNAEGSSYSALGLPTTDQKVPRAWIILNEDPPDAPLKMLPSNVNVLINCSYVEQLTSITFVRPDVLALLRARCQR